VTLDITDTLAPKSDQLDAIDLAVSGPQTFTIKGVSKGSPDQPVNIALEEFPRVWRPGKSMRRVLAAAWGVDASKYVGRKVRLYCDPTVRFGGEAVGGTRIEALSHIDKPLAVPLIITRGKSAVFTVQPLKESAPAKPAPAGPTTADIAATTDIDTLREWWQEHPALRAQIEARRSELTAAAVQGDELPLDDPA